jgi:hypothetical protein
LIFEENTTLGDNNRHIAINEALALIVGQGNCDIGVLDADVEWDAKNTADLGSYVMR